MSQFGKKTSGNKAQPSYFMSILGVTLVLFFLGLVGWLVINANQLGSYFKESVEVQVYLKNSATKEAADSVRAFLDVQPYVKNTNYLNKEAAKQIYIADVAEDFTNIIDDNPLPASVNFYMKNTYVQADTLESVKQILLNKFESAVDDIRYPKGVVENMDKWIKRGIVVFLVLALLLGFLVILLIDNTIRLAMFSNRFLIKTMQMVGATRFFISQPFDRRAIINGAISGVLASVFVYFTILLLENISGNAIKVLGYSKHMWIIYALIIIIGIVITLYSTHRSVIKYLKMKLDDLY